MASDTVNTVNISLSDCDTKSVTLGPQWATVVRELKDVHVEPGPNEIIIYGLDFTVDLDSVRVTGHGPATITDIQTEIVPQKEQFEDAFPEESDDEDGVNVTEEDPDDDYGVDRSELTEVEMALKGLFEELSARETEQGAAAKSLEFLEHYGNKIEPKEMNVGSMGEYIEYYQKERARLGETYYNSTTMINDLQKEIQKVRRTKDRLSAAFQKARNAAAKQDREKREKQLKARNLKSKEKARLRAEQNKFWAWNVGQVVLHLDGFADLTPRSSRRNSTVSGKKPEPTTIQGPEGGVSLQLTYVTTQAKWTPRYELCLKTPTSSGSIVYRAEYHNFSSETWRDAKLILSTSQTSFSGLGERIPFLQPWNVKLLKDQENEARTISAGHWKGGLETQAERDAKKAYKSNPYGNKNYGNSFGNAEADPKRLQDYQMQLMLLEQQNKRRLMMSRQEQDMQRPRMMAQQQQQQQQQQMQQIMPPPLPPQQTAPQGAALFGGTSSGGFGSAPPAPDGGLFSMASYAPQASTHEAFDMDSSATDDESDTMDSATLSEPMKELTFQESSRQDYGLTTTYEIPGQRTLRPSSLKRRHVIAELELSSVTFSHVIVPKLRPAAFLKAGITNTSSVSLLRGKAGLTLDDTFLGSTSIPSCSPNSFFPLSLGTDPAIHVTYGKPTVRRATAGFFNKEDCAIFTRSCRIHNTKTTTVDIVVLDQIPVSEDERLRIDILEPRGLAKEGESVKISADKGTKNWGKGTVKLNKSGEIRWELTLEKGKEVRLGLEYEARIPSGQKIVGLDSF